MGLIVGSDESLKGDTFGGMTVASVRCDDFQREQLEEIGVRDSKKLTDQRIIVLAQKIRELVPVFFINYFPSEYNKLVLEYGLTTVLNKMHTESTNALRTGFEKVIIDKYPGCKVADAELLEKAEDLHIEVAAASIIARAEALKQMQELSIRAGFTLPKGSTHVTDALLKMRDLKLPFDKFTKISFKNVKVIMDTR